MGLDWRALHFPTQRACRCRPPARGPHCATASPLVSSRVEALPSCFWRTQCCRILRYPGRSMVSPRPVPHGREGREGRRGEGRAAWCRGVLGSCVIVPRDTAMCLTYRSGPFEFLEEPRHGERRGNRALGVSLGRRGWSAVVGRCRGSGRVDRTAWAAWTMQGKIKGGSTTGRAIPRQSSGGWEQNCQTWYVTPAVMANNYVRSVLGVVHTSVVE